MLDLQEAIENIPCNPPGIEATYAAGHKDAIAAAAKLVEDYAMAAPDAAGAAIQYVLGLDDNHETFLRLWLDGEFDVLRAEWPDIPDDVFIGADTLFKPKDA